MSKIVTVEEEEVIYGVLIKTEDKYLVFFQKIIHSKAITQKIRAVDWLKFFLLKFGFEVPSYKYCL